MANPPAAAPAADRQPGAPPAPGAPTKPAAGAPAAQPAPGAPGAPPKPQGAPAATALQPDPGAEPGPAVPPAGDQAGWKERIAAYYGNDPKIVARLERYASERDALNSLIGLQNRISAGELRSSLKKDATPDQIAAYRAEVGIPEKPGDYPMPEGIVFGEDDKPFVESFLTSMHGSNAHPETVKQALKWYYEDREQQIEDLVKRDDEQRLETVRAMTAHWGQDERRNTAMVNALLDGAPPEVAAALKGARGPDDRALLNDWGVMQWLYSVAHQLNPAHTIVPGVTGDIGQAIDDEIAKWDAQMADKNSDYFGGKNHDPVLREKNQARYRELIAARDQRKKVD